MIDENNPMRKLHLGKVVLNIGVGESGEKLNKAAKLLSIITERKPIRTVSTHKIPAWNLKKKEPIGVKVTLRGKDAENILKRCLFAVSNRVKPSCFDEYGNFSFGIGEYIDIQGMKYDPDIGVFGMNVCCTIERKGYRVKRRKINTSKISNSHQVKRDEAMNFIKENFNVAIESE